MTVCVAVCVAWDDDDADDDEYDEKKEGRR